MQNPQFYNPRPRPFNPTFASNNVNYTMRNYLGFANDLRYKQSAAQINEKIPQFTNAPVRSQQQKQISVSINPKNNDQNFQQFRSQSLNTLPSNIQYQKTEINRKPSQKITNRLIKKPSQEDPFTSSTTHLAFSSLSKYGSNSLKDLSAAKDVEVYQKQQKNFNIITNSEKKYYDTIKMHPKYHLETKDQYHRRRKSLIQGRVEAYDQLNQQIERKSKQNAMIKRTYNQIPLQKKKLPFRPKALNNADDMQGLL